MRDETLIARYHDDNDGTWMVGRTAPVVPRYGLLALFVVAMRTLGMW